MKKFYVRGVICAISLLWAGLANSALIVNGSSTANALSLSESFVDFYDYGNGVGGSSNTGLEINDTVTFFLAEFGGAFALFSLVDGTSATGDSTGGVLEMFLTESSGNLGTLDVVDDSIDLVGSTPNSYDFDFAFGAGKNDGLVYVFDDISNVDLLLDINYLSIKIQDAVFLSFDESGITQIALTQSTQLTSVPVSVNSPNSFLLFGLGLVLLLIRRN